MAVAESGLYGHICLGSQASQCSGLSLVLGQGDCSFLVCRGVFFLPGMNDVVKWSVSEPEWSQGRSTTLH